MVSILMIYPGAFKLFLFIFSPWSQEIQDSTCMYLLESFWKKNSRVFQWFPFSHSLSQPYFGMGGLKHWPYPTRVHQFGNNSSNQERLVQNPVEITVEAAWPWWYRWYPWNFMAFLGGIRKGLTMKSWEIQNHPNWWTKTLIIFQRGRFFTTWYHQPVFRDSMARIERFLDFTSLFLLFFFVVTELGKFEDYFLGARGANFHGQVLSIWGWSQYWTIHQRKNSCTCHHPSQKLVPQVS